MQLPSSDSVGDLDKASNEINASEYTGFSSFNREFNNDNSNKDITVINKVNALTMEYFNKVIGYRSLKQVQHFVKAFTLSGGSEENAIDIQLVSKFIPKLKFIYSENQNELQTLMDEIKILFMEVYNLSEEKINELQIINQINNIIRELEE